MSCLTNEHLLRFEGVNLTAILDDTDEISIRRGASLMLRQAVKEVTKEIPALQPISEGASVGLFQFSGTDPKSQVDAVANYLNTRYPHLTFAVDSVPITDGFPQALEEVTAKNRFRQFQQLTLVPPARTGGILCCQIDRVRPALRKTDTQNIKNYWASQSALDRFLFGRDSRNGFYRRELDEDIDYQFTDNLAQLAEPVPGQDFGNLNDKLAVIYCDGNKFGEKQRRCTIPEELQAFDHCVQDYRRQFLRDLLRMAARDSAFMSHERLRLEILLWGGDEILLVVPAWKGLATLQRFYEVSAEWTFKNEPLTHASGIVFCHHKTPISRVIQTAKDLADGVKQVTGDKNFFDYLVLESIDYPTQALKHFRELRYGEGVEAICTPLSPFTTARETPWAERIGYLTDFLEMLPRSALHEVAQLWVACHAVPSTATKASFEQRVQRLLEVSDREIYSRLRTEVFRYFLPENQLDEQGYDHIGWLHLTELWDYFAPV